MSRSENAIPTDTTFITGGSGDGQQVGLQLRIDARNVVPALNADAEDAAQSGLSQTTAHRSIVSVVANADGSAFTAKPVLDGVLQPGESVSVDTAAISADGDAGAQARPHRDTSGWVVLVDENGGVADTPEPPSRLRPQLLPKGRDRSQEVSRVTSEVRAAAKQRMAEAPTLTDFVLWHKAAYTDGQYDRADWKWDFARPTSKDLIAEHETDENRAEIAGKVATIEGLKGKIDTLEPRDDMVRVAMKRIDKDYGGISIPSYQVLATFPPGIFVEDALERFYYQEATEKAQKEARERGEAATVFFEPTSPCVSITCGDLETEFGAQAFYIPFRELVRAWENADGAINGIKPGADGRYYYVTERAPDGTPIAKEDKNNYLLAGLQGGFRDSDFFRVRISDYPHWNEEYASAQEDDTISDRQVVGDLAPGETVQLENATVTRERQRPRD